MTTATKDSSATYDNPEWLREQYGAGKTQAEIADLAGCSRTTINSRMKAFGIEARPPGPQAEDLTGSRFGHLTILRPMSYEEAGRYGYWLCKCDCGTILKKAAGNLRKGHGLDCGCESQFRCYLYRYKADGAERRGLEWALTDEEFRQITKSPCHYCGAPPSNAYTHTRHSRGVYVCNGVDRVDSDRGYTSNNVVPCCKRCNFMKGALEYGEFIAQARKVAKHTSARALDVERMDNADN